MSIQFCWIWYLKIIGKTWLRYLVVSELCNDWLMQQKADVFEQVEGPRGRRALVHLLLVLGLMRVDAFKDAQSPENQRGMRNYLAVTWPLFGCVLSWHLYVLRNRVRCCDDIYLVAPKRLIDENDPQTIWWLKSSFSHPVSAMWESDAFLWFISI